MMSIGVTKNGGRTMTLAQLCELADSCRKIGMPLESEVVTSAGTRIVALCVQASDAARAKGLKPAALRKLETTP